MARLGKILFSSIILFYLLLIPLILDIRYLILLELYTAFPLILPISLFYYCLVDTFTPNPKYSSVYGWLYAEFLEHLALPLVLGLVLITMLPYIFLPTFIFLVVYFYGMMLGEVKKDKDLYKLLALVIGFIILSFFPDIFFFVNAYTNLGWVYLILATIIVCILYFANKLRYDEFVDFAKGYIMLILGVIAVCLIMNVI